MRQEPRAAIGLRDELARFAAAGTLTRVADPVDGRFAACAIAAALEPRAVLFDDVSTAAPPADRAAERRRVVMNTTASRELVAASLGVEPAGLAERYLEALTRPVGPQVTDAAAAVQEVTVLGDDIDLARQLPILTHHEHDGGPYITSGVVFGEHGEVRNLSYHRMQVRSARETGIVVVQRHLHRLLDEADERGEPLPVVIAIGLDAGMLLGAATSGSAAPFGFDELGIVGALRREPVLLAPALTVPLMVPVDAEIVIEGHILPNALADEGPFAEFDGSYESGPARVFRATALTHRADPIYQGLVSGSVAQLNIMGLPNEAVILRSVRAVVPSVVAVHVTLSGLRKFHAIVSVDKRTPGDGADAIVAAFAGHRDLKHVVVVDSDVDPFDLGAVEQAIATTFQADRDLHLLHGGRGNPVDRSLSEDGRTARMGIDATRPLGSSARESAVIPGRADVDVTRYLG